MQKTLHTAENQLFLAMLRERRESAGVTQTDLALRLGGRQTDISKVERGVRRLDVIELTRWLAALNVSLPEFVVDLVAGMERIDALEQHVRLRKR